MHISTVAKSAKSDATKQSGERGLTGDVCRLDSSDGGALNGL